MKKVTLLLVACAAFIASCNNGKKAEPAANTEVVATDSTVYEGLTPAADTYGIRYRLALTSDSTMSFNLAQSYMKSETEVEKSFNYSGQVISLTKIVNGAENKYYRLPTEPNDTINFLVLNDSTLRMVNDQFEEPVSAQGMNYDLKLVK